MLQTCLVTEVCYLCDVISAAVMSTQDIFVTAARKCLSAGKKSLTVPHSLDLAAQVSAVDLGLKAALLYDSNGASSDQVQQYVSSLQDSQLVSRSLLTLDLNGNTLIVNPVKVRSNLERALSENSVAVIDICHSLEKPVLTDPLSGELKSMMHELLLLQRGFNQLTEAEKPLFAGEKSEEWNLCTAFGLLLGYPVVYWFDQSKSYENCLPMTPLMVTTASATWQVDGEGHRCCLFSFSVPAALQEETQSMLENWRLCLQEGFQQQHVLKDLSVCQSAVTLPSVCL